MDARGLEFAYASGRRGIANLDLALLPGERLVVLGPNGAGKSTLLQLLAGLLPPGGGRLSVLGAEGPRRSRALRGRVGVALDRVVHLEPLTALQNAVLLARAAGMPRAAAEAACRPLLAHFELEPDVPVRELSLGMKRKLLLVQALAHRPELVLLDEPTLGLDPAGVAALAQALGERARAGAATLAATNDVRAAPLLGERALFLLGGGAVADEPVESLMARLGGHTRLEVTLGSEGPTPAQLAGSTEGAPRALALSAEGERLVARSSAGARPLPDLLRWLLDRGAAVRDVHVREPDLGDVFAELTGRPLGGEARP